LGSMGKFNHVTISAVEPWPSSQGTVGASQRGMFQKSKFRNRFCDKNEIN